MQYEDIHSAPDCFDDTWADIPFSKLLAWALLPSEDEVLDKLYAKGRADAAAWAQLTGVLDAAVPDQDDWYRYQILQDALTTEPPDMKPLLGKKGEPIVPPGSGPTAGAVAEASTLSS